MSKILELTKAVALITKKELVLLKNRSTHSSIIKSNELIANIIDVLKKEGIFIIKGFYDFDRCGLIKKEIERIHQKYEKKVQLVSNGSDKRLFGGDRVSSLINHFFTNELITKIRNEYYQTSNIVGCTLAAQIKATKDNIGSGNGWHRDSVFGKQLKAILYVTDVTENNGPFQYLTATHGNKPALDNIRKLGIGYHQNRLEQEDIDNVLSSSDQYEFLTITGDKGDLVLVDTTGIHRGKPLVEGERYALTNYYFINKINKNVEELLVI